MKIYTEEQVIKMIEKSRETGLTAEYLTLTTKGIELPSDEEIENKGKLVFNDEGHTIYTHYNTVPSWVKGAKSEAAKEHWYNEFINSQEYKTAIRQAFNQGNSLGILGEHKDGSEYLKLIKKK